MESSLELYIHIPFCARKCNYCDFLSFASVPDVQRRYMDQLRAELRATAPFWKNHSVSSVFIGGGTPSLLDAQEIGELMACIRDSYRLLPDAEITIECNPASTLRHKFAAYRRAGINRLSIGLQSADNAELRMLGRLHSYEEFLKCFQGARLEGFQNINVDLINCLPMQTDAVWRRTLRTVLLLKPEHVSVYNLIIEPGTPFYSLNEKGLLMMPDEDEQAKIDLRTREMLEKQGYRRYEVSNWERRGHACRHNIGYWTGIPYLGFGLGASSYDGKMRYKNTAVLSEYLNAQLKLDDPGRAADALSSIRRETHLLSAEEAMEEFMFLGLRMTDGVRAGDFLLRFGRQMTSVYGAQLAKFCAEGLMERVLPGVRRAAVSQKQRQSYPAADAGFGDRGLGDRGFGDRGFGDKGFGDKGFGDKGFGDKGSEGRASEDSLEEADAGSSSVRYRLTERGMDLSNLVLSEFLLSD